MHARNNFGHREIVITHLIHAPHDLMFKVWTEADHIKQWREPNDFTKTPHEMLARIKH